MLTITGFAITVIIVGVIGFFAFGKTTETIQGEIEVSEYRVSSKVPGRAVAVRTLALIKYKILRLRSFSSPISALATSMVGIIAW